MVLLSLVPVIGGGIFLLELLHGEFQMNHSWKMQELLDNLKLRVSYGTSGSDNIDATLWRETWKTGTNTYNGNEVTTYEPE